MTPPLPDSASIIANSEWLPHRLTKDGSTIEFVHLPRKVQRNLPFLDSRYVEAGVSRLHLTFGELPTREAIPGGNCHFIFHSAFCGSTLLGRALDRDDLATVLQEPQILSDVATAFAAADEYWDGRSALDSLLALLQRPHRTSESTIIKPSNSANGLIELLLALRPQARAVIMYAPLPLFLLKIAIGGATRRKWARSMAKTWARQQSEAAPDLRLTTDLEAAAYVWLQHQAQFANLSRGQVADRLAIIEMGDLLGNPLQTLCRVAKHFGLNLTEAAASEIAAGPAFSQEAKIPGQMFDPMARRMNEAAAQFAYAAEIEAALIWAHDNAEQSRIPLNLREVARA